MNEYPGTAFVLRVFRALAFLAAGMELFNLAADQIVGVLGALFAETITADDEEEVTSNGS